MLLRHPLAYAIALASTMASAEDTCPTLRDEGDFAYAPPQIVVPTTNLPARLAPGAVIASEELAVYPSLDRTGSEIVVDGPLRAKFDNNTLFGRRLVEGAILACVYHPPFLSFQPPVDEDGRPFPTSCLVDRDGDGEFEHMRFFAYHAAPGKGIVDAAITPVRLTAVAVDSNPQNALMHIERRLRVAEVSTERVVLVTDYAISNIGHYEEKPVFQTVQKTTVELPLKEGVARVGELSINLIDIDGNWLATARGAFKPWVYFECGGSSVRLNLKVDK